MIAVTHSELHCDSIHKRTLKYVLCSFASDINDEILKRYEPSNKLCLMIFITTRECLTLSILTVQRNLQLLRMVEYYIYRCVYLDQV